MAAAATLATPSAMDVDEGEVMHSSPPRTARVGDIAKRLASGARINEKVEPPRGDDHEHGYIDKENVIRENNSHESDELPTPEGFFIDSNIAKNSTSGTHEPAISSNGLPPWPGTPQRATSSRPSMISSCPRPTTSSAAASRNRSRPLFVSSSSGALVPPVIEPGESSLNNGGGGAPFHGNFDADFGSCPATRAAAAARELEAANEQLVLSEMIEKNSEAETSSTDMISHQETFHTSHQSGLHNKIGNDVSGYPSSPNEPIPLTENEDEAIPDLYTFTPHTVSGTILSRLSKKFVPPHKQQTHGGSALAGFLALLLVTCANYMLGPMRDAAALAVGVSHIPALTLASTVLALGSSVPVGWLFEAPNPMRRRVWKKMGLTRGETQGSSLALFYRVFAFLLLSYALGFKIVDKFGKRAVGEEGATVENNGFGSDDSAIALVWAFFLRIMMAFGIPVTKILTQLERLVGGMLAKRQFISSTGVHAILELYASESIPSLFIRTCSSVVNKFGKVIYVMFFLVVHLMKLHSLSLMWGVTTEAMEYEENAERRRAAKLGEDGISMMHGSSEGGLVMMGTKSHGVDVNKGEGARAPNVGAKPSKSSLRLKRLGFVGFGGTLGGILGSVIASFAAHILHLSGLLIVAALLLELSAHLSIELGRLMQRHWEEQIMHQSSGDLTSLASGENLSCNQADEVDTSMRKSVSLGSMKRVASGSLSNGNLANLAAMPQRLGGRGSNTQAEDSGEKGMTRVRSIGSMPLSNGDKAQLRGVDEQHPMIDDNSFKQRLLRGITTILRSRLLMAIFTYNALYASTSVLLSFQRAELVANRSSGLGTGDNAVSNTAFLAKINTASSVAVFALQASGLGAYIANSCGQRGALALMPIIRLCGVILLGWWHLMSNGRPPDLILFLLIDEFTKVINFAVAKPVRENLWRGLSAEARYEAKPIVDTLANRWGGGSAAFLVSFINTITDLTGLGAVDDKGERSILGFPPVLLLCMIISAWWTAVSADVGNIRRKIDIELKKQQ